MSVGFRFPPHPDSRMKVRPDSVGRLEQEGGWLAQRKYNGWHSVIHVHKERNICNIWHRSSKPFTKYQMTPEMRECFFRGIQVDPSIEVVLNGELVHGQAVSDITGAQALRHTIALFDLLYLGKPLLTEGFEERYNLLTGICGSPTTLEPKKRGLVVAEVGESKLWLAECFKDDFLYRFYEMYEHDDQGRDKFPEIEGLVCKKAKGSALKLGNVAYDVNWMMRVRKTKEKVYLF
jgi:hypothetical protein